MNKTTQSLVIVLCLSSCIVCSRYGIILKKLDLLKEAVEVFQKSLHQSPLHWGTWLELSTLITDKDMVRGGSQGLRQQGGRAPKEQQGGRTPKPSKITPQDTQNFSKNQKVFYSAYNCGHPNSSRVVRHPNPQKSPLRTPKTSLKIKKFSIQHIIVGVFHTR